MVTPIWNNVTYGISLLSQENTYIYPPHHRHAARIPMRVSGRVVFAFMGHVVRDRKRRRVEALRRKISWVGKTKGQLGNGGVLYEEVEKGTSKKNSKSIW